MPINAGRAALLALLLLGSAHAGGGGPVLKPAFVPLDGQGQDCGPGPDPLDGCRFLAGYARADLPPLTPGQGQVVARGDTLTFHHRADASSVEVCCGVQLPMSRLPGTDRWVLGVHVRELPNLVLTYTFFQPNSPGIGSGIVGTESRVWRGPQAPAAPATARLLLGQVQQVTLTDPALGDRRLSVYTPPGHDPSRRAPVIYLADGESVAELARTLEPAIRAGRVPPVLLVGLHAADREGQLDRRAQEYLPGFDGGQRRFEQHERFFTQVVLPWAERELGAATTPEGRAVFGYSNGAAFALGMAARHPDLFARVIAFSQGWPLDTSPIAKTARVAMQAGSLEPNFFNTTDATAQTLRAGGRAVQMVRRVGGHDFILWQEGFPGAVAWVFVKR